MRLRGINFRIPTVDAEQNDSEPGYIGSARAGHAVDMIYQHHCASVTRLLNCINCIGFVASVISGDTLRTACLSVENSFHLKRPSDDLNDVFRRLIVTGSCQFLLMTFVMMWKVDKLWCCELKLQIFLLEMIRYGSEHSNNTLCSLCCFAGWTGDANAVRQVLHRCSQLWRCSDDRQL